MNSKIFIEQEADEYYERNKKGLHSYFIDYLIDIFPKKNLYEYDVAEFGIGNGQNLMFLKQFAKNVHGFDCSKKALEDFNTQYRYHPCTEYFDHREVNLAEDFLTPIKYDLVIMGFFAYYVDNDEMEIVYKNLINSLKEGKYVYLFDFLVRENTVKTDKRNENLKIYKRNIKYWIDYFKGFDLVDFRLFDYKKHKEYTTSDNISKIDISITDNDDDWYFSALFRMK